MNTVFYLKKYLINTFTYIQLIFTILKPLLAHQQNRPSPKSKKNKKINIYVNKIIYMKKQDSSLKETNIKARVAGSMTKKNHNEIGIYSNKKSYWTGAGPGRGFLVLTLFFFTHKNPF